MTDRQPQRGDVMWYRLGGGRWRAVIVLAKSPWEDSLSWFVLCGTEKVQAPSNHLRWPGDLPEELKLKRLLKA